MKRIELTEREPVIVSRSDYEADRKRGFTVLEYMPEGELVIKNSKRPGQEIRRPKPATHLFRCMLCQFDVTDTDYSNDPETSAPRRGMDLIEKHMAKGKHPWRYGTFSNPYGNVAEVTIEGVEDYSKEISQ